MLDTRKNPLVLEFMSTITTTMSIKEAEQHFSKWQSYIEAAETGNQKPWISERARYNEELRDFFAPAREEFSGYEGYEGYEGHEGHEGQEDHDEE